MATHCWFLSWEVLPGKSHGQRSLAGSSPWGHKEADAIQQLNNNNKEFFRQGPYDGGLVNLEKFQMNILRKLVLDEKHFRERILILRECTPLRLTFKWLSPENVCSF